jgi:hypothetical protein
MTMQGTVPIAFGSPAAAPEVGVEPVVQQVAEPPVEPQATTPPEIPGQVGQTESAPVESSVQQPANEYEQRFKDTQRALAQREQEIIRRDAQIELLKSLAAQQPQHREPPPPAFNVEEFKQKVGLQPDLLVDQMIERDNYWRDQFVRQEMRLQEQLAQLNPDYQTLQPALKAIEDMPEMQHLSPSARMEMVKRIQATTSGPRATMPPTGTAPGQRRVVPPTAQPPTGEQRFAAQLVASGAAKTQTVPGAIAWQVSGRK